MSKPWSSIPRTVGTVMEVAAATGTSMAAAGAGYLTFPSGPVDGFIGGVVRPYGRGVTRWEPSSSVNPCHWPVSERELCP